MSAPVLEGRSAEQLAAALRARIPAFVPGWQAAPGGPGSALLEIYGHFLRALAQRIDAAPDKNELAFLDLLGLDVLPAGAARAPVVFSTIPAGGNGRAPARTRLGAKGPDPARPVVFETERPVALADARLSDVYTVWPGRDAYADHSAAAIGGRPFTLWDGLESVAHELYLAHDLHFALTGRASVALQVELAPGGSEPLDLDWSWWDGSGWRPFKRFAATDRIGESLDGTAGLTRSGTIRLETDCAAGVQRRIGGWAGHWLRASVVGPLPPDPSRSLPQLDRIVVRTVVSQALDAACTTGLTPDSAFADGQQLDLTKQAQPLGANPGSGSAFYMTCAEAFSRPQATVTICIRKAVTPADEADAKSHRYELDVTKAKQLLDAARKAAKLTKDALDGLAAAELDTTNLPDLWAPNQPNQWYAGVRATVATVRTTVLEAIPFAVEALRLSTAQMVPGFGFLAGFIGLHDPRDSLLDLITVANLLSATPGSYALESSTLRTKATSLVSQATGVPPVPDFSSWFDLPGSATQFVTKVNADSIFLPAALPAIFTDAQTHFDDLKNRLENARIALQNARTQAQIVIDKLALLSPMSAAAASGFLPPTLDPPKLAWEYWNGSDWRTLGVTASPADVDDLRADGEITFTVPDNWASSTVNGVDGLWARARLQSGSYAKLRLVSWLDQETQAVNFLPIIEPRPPVLSALRIGYTWTSQPAAPQHVLTLNDFRWEDHTEDAGWRGGTFAPFQPVADATPALYLGFDRQLPADELGIFLDLELADVETGPPLDWECWDGAAWRRLTVADETDDLAVPGIVTVVWPGGPAPSPATVTSAAGQELHLVDVRAASRFTGGDLVWVQAGEAGELGTVAAVREEIVTTTAPLTQDYGQATVVRAGLPRFGTPRTWLRARLHRDGDPLPARVRGIHPNAVWAAQVETLEDELLGGGNGEPRQAFFLSRTPVLSVEVIEVRELEGARAHVEFPLLLDDLRRRGVREDDVRVVRDAATGHVQEVWVPWRRCATLAFSGPSDRDYTLERTRGRLLFGDGVHGLVLPAGADNVRARRYRSGGGEAGNVAAGAIDQVLSGALVAGVVNPVRAEGGAATESDAAVRARGPLTVRHRWQALTASDYEALACEASPGVAVARATDRRGSVTVAIVPYSPDAVPEPSWELRREVRDFLRARAPAALAGAVSVVPPTYALVGVRAVIAPRSPDLAGSVAATATAALRRYLHPLTGGPAGTGWPFGRPVRLSDVAALLERLEDLDHVAELVLMVGGAPQGESVSVPHDALVAAGTMDVELEAAG